MDSAVIALAGGAAAFAHCLGMCGGFVLHLSLGEQARRGWLRPALRQALWHLGRIGSSTSGPRYKLASRPRLSRSVGGALSRGATKRASCGRFSYQMGRSWENIR